MGRALPNLSIVRRGLARAGFALAGGVICGGAILTTGCAATTAQPAVEKHEIGSFNPPVIISSRPKQDAAAYQESEDQLSEADWKELEKLGPRPIWEQLNAKRPPRHLGDPHVTPTPVAHAPNEPATRPTTAPVFDESELPVQTVYLPDGKVRL